MSREVVQSLSAGCLIVVFGLVAAMCGIGLVEASAQDTEQGGADVQQAAQDSCPPPPPCPICSCECPTGAVSPGTLDDKIKKALDAIREVEAAEDRAAAAPPELL